MRDFIRYSLLVLLIAATCIGGFVGYFLWGIHRSIAQLDAVPLTPANYQPAALELVTLCQSDPSLYSQDAVSYLDPFDPVWAPPSVATLHPEGVDIAADHATVTWGGGFYHCGWQLDRGTATTDGSGFTWTLSFFSENRPNPQVLQTITIPASQRLTKEQFINQVLSEFDRRLAAQSDDGMMTSQATWYPAAARCVFLAKNKRVDLLPAQVRKAAGNYPHDWRDVLLGYLLNHAVNDPSADQKLRQWADQTNCPAAWMYASYGFYQARDSKDGDDAIEKATATKSSDPEWIDKDVPLYELGMAARLYQSGNFSACAKLCDGIMASPHRYFTTASAVQRAHDCAAATGSSRPSKLPEFDQYTSLDPFGGFDLNLLIATTRVAPTKSPSPLPHPSAAKPPSSTSPSATP